MPNEIIQLQKVYLGCPYTHEDPVVRKNRYDAVTKATCWLINQDLLVYSPISYTHHLCLVGGYDFKFETWEELDKSFLEWADSMVVLQLPGWERSMGIEEEVGIISFMGKTIAYLRAEPFMVEGVKYE